MTISARVSVLDSRSLIGTTVRLSVAPETPIADLVTKLEEVAPVDGDLYFNGLPLTSFATVAELDLQDGQILSVGAALPPLRDSETHPGVDVLIVGGPDAGRVLTLPFGRHEIGRDSFRAVALNDPEVSRNHAQLDVTAAGVTLSDLDSANGTLLDGREVSTPVQLEGGEYIRVGKTVFVVTTPEAPDTALVRGHDGTLTYNRRFRSAPSEHDSEVEFPSEFEEEPPPAISFVYLVVPMVIGVVMALVMGPRFLIFAFLGPASGVGGMIASRRQHATRQERQREKHQISVQRAQQKLEVALRGELQNRRDASPDLASLVRAARGPRRRLWERRATDSDFLDLRIGLGNRPSAISVRGDSAPEAPMLPDVPVTVSMVEAGSIGVAGNAELAIGIARSFIFQIATLHSPSDVRICVISPNAAWGWTRWLPHLRSLSEDDRLMIGGDPPTARLQLDTLEALIAQRKNAPKNFNGTTVTLPRFVVLFDRSSTLDRFRVSKILADGPAVGIHGICIEDTEPELPEEYAGATVIQRDDRLFVRVRNRPTVSDISEEIIHNSHADIAARCLAPLRPESISSGSVPTSCRLLEAMQITAPTPTEVARRWESSEGRCRATVGVGSTGVLQIELNDRSPHALVAGMPGSGKSEFVKTLLAALAIENHPDDLQFLLIDFKGGGDYRTLERLPHTVDLVTNIDDSEHAAVKRAISLLEAEVERRQREINLYGARDLATYRKVRESRPDIPTMGRLLVVADEFGELASQRPELLENLVSVARTGRALGVHLLLATQRPRGSITGQIQANVPLRICFRVVAGEAGDVIGSSEPERIPKNLPGRGYVRDGDESPIEFQCARVANPRPAVAATVAPITVTVESWSRAGSPMAASEERVEVPDPDTDLWDVVEASIIAAESLGWIENPVPWPRPLPETIRFSPNRAVVRPPTGWPEACIGIRDDPADQRHVPYTIGVGKGNVAVVGSPGSGRTTALRTMTAALAYSTPPSKLHIHALDFAGGGLRSIRPVPHVGTITDDPGIASRLLDKLEEQIDERRAQFAMAGWSSLIEQWESVDDVERIPAAFLLVDGWNTVAEMSARGTGQTLSERIIKVMNGGSSVGFQVIIAGDRSAAIGQVGRQIAHRLVLRFNDPVDYQSLDVDSRSIPSDHIDGRALIPMGRGSVDHVQIAHIGKDPSGTTQTKGLRIIGEHLSSVSFRADDRPFTLAPLPPRFELSDAFSSPDAPTSSDGSIQICVGVGGDEARPIWTDLANISPGLCVAGQRGSGRSTTLLSIARSILRAGTPIIVGFNHDSPLEGLKGIDGVLDTRVWNEYTIDDLQSLSDTQSAVLLVDDCDGIQARDETMSWAVDQTASGLITVATATTSAWSEVAVGWVLTLRRSACSILLWPSSKFDGAAVGLNGMITPEMQFSKPPGRALWTADNKSTIIQTPT